MNEERTNRIQGTAFCSSSNCGSLAFSVGSVGHVHRRKRSRMGTRSIEQSGGELPYSSFPFPMHDHIRWSCGGPGNITYVRSTRSCCCPFRGRLLPHVDLTLHTLFITGAKPIIRVALFLLCSASPLRAATAFLLSSCHLSIHALQTYASCHARGLGPWCCLESGPEP